MYDISKLSKLIVDCYMVDFDASYAYWIVHNCRKIG